MRPSMRTRTVILLVLASLGVGCQSVVPPTASPLEPAPTSTSLQSTSPAAPTPSPRPSPTPFDEFVDEGDPVTAAGFIDIVGNSPRICRMIVGPLGGSGLGAGGSIGPGIAPCFLQSVQLDDIASAAHGRYVRVNGTWVDSMIHVDAWEEADPPRRPSPHLDCDPPAEGWNPGGGRARSRARDKLHEHLESHRESLVGVGYASDSHGDLVLMVGTTERVETATQVLQELYPFGLCVVPMEYSAAELDAIRELLVDVSDPFVEIDEETGELAVYARVLTRSTAAVVAEFPGAIRVDAIATVAQP